MAFTAAAPPVTSGQVVNCSSWRGGCKSPGIDSRALPPQAPRLRPDPGSAMRWGLGQRGRARRAQGGGAGQAGQRPGHGQGSTSVRLGPRILGLLGVGGSEQGLGSADGNGIDIGREAVPQPEAAPMSRVVPGVQSGGCPNKAASALDSTGLGVPFPLCLFLGLWGLSCLICKMELKCWFRIGTRVTPNLLWSEHCVPPRPRSMCCHLPRRVVVVGGGGGGDEVLRVEPGTSALTTRSPESGLLPLP